MGFLRLTARFVLVFIIVEVGSNEFEVSCQAGNYALGSRGEIVCNFGKDVNQTKHNFNVIVYPFEEASISNDGIYVLLCNWDQGVLTCKIEEGFEFNYKVSSTLTVKIPRVSTKAEGLYVCQLVPHGDGFSVNTCNLTTVEAHGPSSGKNEKSPPVVTFRVYVATTAALGGLALIFGSLALIFCLLYRRNRACTLRLNSSPIFLGSTIMPSNKVKSKRASNKKGTTRTDREGGNKEEEEEELLQPAMNVKYGKKQTHRQAQVSVAVVDKEIQVPKNIYEYFPWKPKTEKTDKVVNTKGTRFVSEKRSLEKNCTEFTEQLRFCVEPEVVYRIDQEASCV